MDQTTTAPLRAWRDGHLLVVPALSRLDDRCFTCGEPAAASRPQLLYWHPPAWYLLILLSPIVYIAVGLAIRQRADLTVGLCATHAAARQRQRRTGGALVALAILLIIAAIGLAAGVVALPALIALIAGIALLSRANRIVRVHSIHHGTARISNGSPHLRAGLPDFAGRAW